MFIKNMNIYITSWNRPDFTFKTISLIKERTKIPISINVFDNGSLIETQKLLFEALNKDYISTLFLSNKNTGTLYNKIIFHAMQEYNDKFYVVTDNDVLPPELDVCWLTQMLTIMQNYPKIGLLALQLPPQVFQVPLGYNNDVVYCKYVGNTFKLVRKEAMNEIIPLLEQKKIVYGDDSLVSNLMYQIGYEVAFTRNIWCLHIGQCKNWGYTQQQVKEDPRKSGYGEPFIYQYNNKTYEPQEQSYKLKFI